VSYYAQRLNITPKYLNTISKSITGHTAKSIIDHYVVLKLKVDLSGSDCPIKQIAWNYNFSDVSFFTRYFRLHTGTTPTAYRKSSAQSAQLGIVGK
jgi:AraC family transcriptional regulator, transcriptional activator of pobA